MSKPTAPEILEAAAGHLRDRAATYDKPEGERSMAATVGAFNVITGHNLTEEQGWLLMGCLKMVRAQSGKYRADSYEDGAAYFALAGESAAVDRVFVESWPKVPAGPEITQTLRAAHNKPPSFPESNSRVINAGEKEASDE